MHKYRSAARTAAWFEAENDPPSYNPFRRPNLRQRNLYRIDVDSDDETRQTALETHEAALDHFDLRLTHINHSESSSTPPDEKTQSTPYSDPYDAPTNLYNVEGSGLQAIDAEETPSGDVLPGLGKRRLGFAITKARSRRNIFRRNIAHGLDHIHIGQKIGEIGRTIAAHGYPADKEATVHTLERTALVIDFEKVVDRAKDSDALKPKSTGGPILYPCSQALTLFGGLALLHHPSTNSSDYALHLRVFHVQNDPQILEDIFSVFKLNSTEFNCYGTVFKEFALNAFTERRSGKQTWFWRPSYDRTRDVLRLAFSLEYHTPRVLESKVGAFAKGRDHDEDQESIKSASTQTGSTSLTPEYGFYRKRLSIYIQHKRSNHLHQLHGSPLKREDMIGLAQVDDVVDEMSDSMSRQHIQDAISSENTILIVEKTLASGKPIFQAEDQWKQLWTDSEIPLSPRGERDGTAALELLQAIVRFSFNKIVSDWRGYVKVMDSHISMLEERIYDKPEDDSQAKELWRTSKQLLEMEKLLISQTFLIKVVQDNFISPASPNTADKEWLKDLLTDFEELRNDIQEDLIKAVTQMVDLMYKSVSIRDARKSVELNTSLWRLSWITFIFLPLTFLVGFFGMNVDTFHNTPSIKWYFITAIPFMCFILLLWFAIKYFMDRDALKP